MEFLHEPVLLKEVIDGLNLKEGMTVLDGTVGGAGHSYAIAEKIGESGTLICLDQDDDALCAAKKALNGVKPRVHLVKTNFGRMDKALEELGIKSVDGILLDIGVSSYQLDSAKRGFTYKEDSVLDMRMDENIEKSARELVNTLKESELYRIIRDYGEEAWASRIAKFICEKRKEKEIKTAFELVEIIKAAIPKEVRRDGGHPARKTFQALRIAVNDELQNLEKGIKAAVKITKPGGRIAIITFHSLEDRIVKDMFKEGCDPCTCPKKYPQCICNKAPYLKLVNRKPVIPTEEETAFNMRARSAKLRVAERI